MRGLRRLGRARPAALLAAALAVAATGAMSVGALAGGGMRSTKLAPQLCETTGGGRFVGIPGFPGEQIDRRLLADVRMLVRRYEIFVTDGYSMSRVHSRQGEHPLGLALDIVPNGAKGGSWGEITRLANWSEPRQNRPRSPFRWVGYNGDAGHGRGDHLHLSWSHSESRPGDPARTIYSVRCPGSGGGGGGPDKPDPPKPDPPKPDPDPTGGVGGKNNHSGGGGKAGDGKKGQQDGRPPSGGISGNLAPPVAESGGISAR